MSRLATVWHCAALLTHLAWRELRPTPRTVRRVVAAGAAVLLLRGRRR